MGKTAVYAGTKNTYEDILISCKSLFANSDVDTVYLFIEDDEFPMKLPREVKTINVSDKKALFEGGANEKSRFTYMGLLKSALCRFVPKVKKALMLDYDTIVVDDISELWDTDLKGFYWAGVPDLGVPTEPGKPKYFNSGVALMNFELLRKDGVDKAMLEDLNVSYARYGDQDVLNKFCYGSVLEIPVCYNESPVTGHTMNPKIVHYAGLAKENGYLNRERRHFYNAYKTLDWPDIQAKREARYGKSLTI